LYLEFVAHREKCSSKFESKEQFIHFLAQFFPCVRPMHCLSTFGGRLSYKLIIVILFERKKGQIDTRQ